MGCICPSLESVLNAHNTALEFGGGGLHGFQDQGRLESLLDHLANDDYYPTLERKLARLFFGLTKFHCFNDGNKRTAIAATALMLDLNLLASVVPRFIRDMENICVQVADNIVSEDFLHEIICVHTAGDPDNEAVKLRLFELLTARDARG